MTKHHGNRLGFAVLLAFFRNQGRFPRTAREIDQLFVAEIAQQLAIVAPSGFAPGLAGRTAERHRADIRTLAGFREASVADAALFEDWLRDQVAGVGAVPDQLVALLETRCRALSIEPPAADRIVRAAIRADDERFCGGVLDRLVPATRERLERCCAPPETNSRTRARLRRREWCRYGFCGCAAIRASRASPAFKMRWPSWS
jgi:hypothetical protein